MGCEWKVTWDLDEVKPEHRAQCSEWLIKEFGSDDDFETYVDGMFKYTTIAYIYRSYGFSLARWAEEHREALELWPGLILTQTCMENDPDEVFQVSEKWLGLLDKLKEGK